MNFSVQHADKEQLKELLPELFEILYSNMATAYPTGDTKEEDYRIWSEYFPESLEDPTRKLVLISVEQSLAGYFQYRTTEDLFMMEDIQMKQAYHGSGVFRALYCWLVHQLPQSLKTVEAYTNKKNFNTQGILEHLGLEICGENKNGKSFHYRGNYQNLLKKYL